MANELYVMQENKCLVPLNQVLNNDSYAKIVDTFSGSVTLSDGTGSTNIDITSGFNANYMPVVSSQYKIDSGHADVIFSVSAGLVASAPKIIVNAYSPSGASGTVEFNGVILDLS